MLSTKIVCSFFHHRSMYNFVNFYIINNFFATHFGGWVDSLLTVPSSQGSVYRFVFGEKQSTSTSDTYTPRTPERCHKFRDISASGCCTLRDMLAWVCDLGAEYCVYMMVRRLRARTPFVHVIIVALFDSNLVLGSFVLIY